MTQQTQQQGIEITSQALPSEGLSRFVRMGAWAAMVGGMAGVVSMLLAWLVVPYERLGPTEAYPQGFGCSAWSCWCGGS